MAFKNIYSPTNPDKYKGDYPIIARSSWEFEFMTYLDPLEDLAEVTMELLTSMPGIDTAGAEAIKVRAAELVVRKAAEEEE